MGAAASASSQPNSTAMCDKCLVKFTLFKSKNKCMECEKNYCDDCFIKSTQSGRFGGRTHKLCVKCNLLLSGNFGRNDLELYRVRDLQHFLTRRRVPTDKCCQKEDLVELMLLYSKKLDPMYEDEPNHIRHVLELRERRILSDENLRQAAGANSAETSTSRAPSSSGDTPRVAPPAGGAATTAAPMGSTNSSGSTSVERPSSVADNTNASGSHTPPVQPPAPAARPPASATTPASTSAPPVRPPAPAPAPTAQPPAPATAPTSASPVRPPPPSPTTQPPPAQPPAPAPTAQSPAPTTTPTPAAEPPAQPPAAPPATAASQKNVGASNTPDMKRVRLDDINSEAAVDGLTIRQLKEVLTNSYVDYKGCVERNELVTRVKNLWIDHQKNVQKAALIEAEEEKTPASGSVAAEMCKVCMDAVIDCVLLDCGHMVTCTQCGKKMAECPICRQFVVRVVHVFRS